MIVRLDDLVETIQSFRYNFTSENELQQGIERALKEIPDLKVEREKILSSTERIDFLVNENIGIECKIEGSLSDLTRQLHRYAQLPEIECLVVVTNRNRLANLPAKMSGKDLWVVTLRSSAF